MDDRLTRRNPDGGINVDDLPAALEKLAAYEDAETEGRLTILPFKYGDGVWMVSANEPMTVKGVTVTVCAFDRHGRHGFPLTDWGRFVFPTKEAADEAFEKMAQEMVEAGGV